MAQRSTKGASKQRRDAINDKIAQMRELIPVSEAVRPRLSQLQVMALTNAYIAKSNFFDRRYLEADTRSTFWSDMYDACPTLPGFLLIVSVADGRILYVSDSVSEYLGNSAVDILTQMDSVYELIDDRDRAILRQAIQKQQALAASSPAAAAAADPWMRDVHAREMFGDDDQKVHRLSFTCRMNVAARGFRNNMTAQASTKFGFDRQKIMQVNGQFVRQKPTGYCSSYNPDPTSAHVLVAYCTPHLGILNGSSAISGFTSADNIEGNTNAFCSVHRADMKFVRIEPNGEHHIGYSREEIGGKSWYEMIHPADIETARGKHMELLGDCQIGDTSSVKSCCVRVQTARGNFLWLHVILRIHDADGPTSAPVADLLPVPAAMLSMTPAQPLIICTNHVIDEQMAAFIRARESEVESSTLDENSYQPSVIGKKSIGQIEDGMRIPDFELSEIFGATGVDIVSRQRTGNGQKRTYNNEIDGNGIVPPPMKISKILDEDSFEMIPSQNMVLSMPSPPGPRWEQDYYQQVSSSHCLPTYSTLYGNGLTQSFGCGGSSFAVNSCATTTTTAVNSFSTVGPMQIQEPSYFDVRGSPPLVAMPDGLVAETYMAVPDILSNNIEWELPTMYGNEPVVKSRAFPSVPTSLPILAKGRPASNHGVSLPELDQNLVESVLDSLETVPDEVASFHRNVASPVEVERYPNDNGAALIQELLYLGQEFLKTDLGSIYNDVDALNFV